MKLRALVFSTDPEVRSAIRRFLGTFEINADVCTTFECAVEYLAACEYQAIIGDCDVASTRELFRAGAQFATRKPMLVGLVRASMKSTDAFAMGATLAIAKPIKTWVSFQTLYNLILKEERRHASWLANIPVQLRGIEMGKQRFQAIEISEERLVLRSDRNLFARKEVFFQFDLPGGKVTVSGKGAIELSVNNQFILRFQSLSAVTLNSLRVWLGDRFEREHMRKSKAGVPKEAPTANSPLAIAADLAEDMTSMNLAHQIV